MNEVIRKEILEILDKVISVLEIKEEKDIEELKELSDRAVEMVALYKDVDIISMTVMVYSFYKIITAVNPKDYQELLRELKFARESLKEGNLGKYNKSIKSLFEIVKRSNAKVKEHLEDVMQAARIKKGAVLLEKGLSIGQAAGLMGLSNWDLQQYAGKTTALESHQEIMPGNKRMATALKMFGM